MRYIEVDADGTVISDVTVPDPPAADPAAAVLAAVQTARNEIYRDGVLDDGYQSDIVIDSPDGTPYRLVVANDGTLSTEEVT